VSPSFAEADGEGETVGEARWAALRELERQVPGLDRDAVEVEVVSEGSRGLMGVGREPARVHARVGSTAQEPPTPAATAAEASPEAARVAEVVSRIAAAVAPDLAVAVEEDGERIVAIVSGPSAGLIIGRHGHTIDAVQQLAAAIAFPPPGDRREVVVDAQGYRARRERTLAELAHQAADDAVAERVAMELDPMSSAERKIVHEALVERADVETASEGREPARFVVITPVARDDV
jgi:spoIIIJ-associated protein